MMPTWVFFMMIQLSQEAPQFQTISRHVGDSYFREEILVKEGTPIGPQWVTKYLKQKVAQYPDKELVAIWFFTSARDVFGSGYSHLSHRKLARLWELAGPCDAIAEALSYKGVEWIRIAGGQSPSALSPPNFARFHVGTKTAEIALLRYWTPKSVKLVGNEALDVYLISPFAWDEREAADLAATVLQAFPSRSAWIELANWPWFPESGRFPIRFPFAPADFLPPSDQEFVSTRRTWCSVLEGVVTCSVGKR